MTFKFCSCYWRKPCSSLQYVQYMLSWLQQLLSNKTLCQMWSNCVRVAAPLLFTSGSFAVPILDAEREGFNNGDLIFWFKQMWRIYTLCSHYWVSTAVKHHSGQRDCHQIYMKSAFHYEWGPGVLHWKWARCQEILPHTHTRTHTHTHTLYLTDLQPIGLGLEYVCGALELLVTETGSERAHWNS
jgi:hypothetical protein